MQLWLFERVHIEKRAAERERHAPTPKSSNRRSISWRRLSNGRRGRNSDGAAVSVVTGIFEVSSAMTHPPKCRWARKLAAPLRDCSRAPGLCYKRMSVAHYRPIDGC